MSLRYIFKLFIAYISRFKGIILIGILIGIISFLLLSVLIPRVFKGQKDVIGVTGRYRPNELPQEILSKIGQGLTRLENTNLKPALAEKWESPDKGKTWIFKLKEGIFWQDGSKLVSSDINYEFSDVSIERPDDRTLIFTLEKGPYSPFPSVLSKAVFKKGLLGTGEWEVKKLSVVNTYVQELILEKGDDTLHYKFFPTDEQTKLAYKLGKVKKITDILDPTPLNLWNNSILSQRYDKSQVVTIFFNTQDKLLGEKSVRQALFYAIEKDSLGIKARSPINPDSWAYNPQLKPYDYDIEKAKELIDKLPKEMKDSLEIKLVSTPILLSVAEKISRNWEDVGLKTQIQVSSIVPQEFQVFLTILDIPDDPDQYTLWHSTQAETNISNFISPRIDKYLEDGRIELDLEERRKIYLDFQRYLLEDLPAAFLYHPSYYNVTRKRVF